MKKIKLSLKVLSSMLIFALIGITSCNKTNFNFDEGFVLPENNLEISRVFQKDITIEKVIADLFRQNRIVSIDKNYTDKNTGAKGTLYTYKFQDEFRQILKVSKEPVNIGKEVLKGVVGIAYTDVNGDVMFVEYECSGSGSNCVGWSNFYIAW